MAALFAGVRAVSIAEQGLRSAAVLAAREHTSKSDRTEDWTGWSWQTKGRGFWTKSVISPSNASRTSCTEARKGDTMLHVTTPKRDWMHVSKSFDSCRQAVETSDPVASGRDRSCRNFPLYSITCHDRGSHPTLAWLLPLLAGPARQRAPGRSRGAQTNLSFEGDTLCQKNASE